MTPDAQVIVVGAGHAGCEAALAAARCGARVLVVTINLDTVAAMPCNPSIGGQGKGQLVREIDVLGGAMGRVADETLIQARLLNTRKGLAVQAIRVQSDKEAYGRAMRQALQADPRIHLLQGQVTELLLEAGCVAGVRTQNGDGWRAPVVVLTPGTFLRGLIHIGSTRFAAGRAGEPPADALGEALATAGLPLRRFKTGTPPRVDGRTLRSEGLERQDHESATPRFSLWSDPARELPKKSCFLTHTNAATHAVIRRHLHESALVAGRITGTGPRYCPSIEDKISKFPDRPAHKVFLEPEGAWSSEIYLQGLSTSLPERVQEEYVRTLPGLEEARLVRPGYAIEYDIIDPLDLHPTLMSRRIAGLFAAGQINGTSGYEEAAAQGLLAGINAAALALGRELQVLDGQTSFLGHMIEEITSIGITEPYRIFASRSPFRLNLRMSNAEERLGDLAARAGVIGDQRWQALREREDRIAALGRHCEETQVTAEELAAAIGTRGGGGGRLAQILKRPEATLEDFRHLCPQLGELDLLARWEVEARIKYAGYLQQADREQDLRRQVQDLPIPPEFYAHLPSGLSTEARQKLLAVRPATLGALGRVPGVRAGDVALVMMRLRLREAVP